MSKFQTARAQDGEAGYMLLAVIVLVAFVLLALAVAAPVVTRDLRRDKEVESRHRQDEYVRALRLYQRKLKTYPASLEAMEKTNNVRYLRKQYIDPLTGNADWRLIRVGQNQTTVSVFFGEPIGGLNGAGAGGLGSAAGMSAGNAGGIQAPGPVNALGAGFAGANSGGTGTSGSTGTTSSGLPTTSVSSLGSGGAGPIMGVGSSKTGDAILALNKQTTFDTEEDLYDPRIEQYYAKGRLGGGVGSQNAAGFGQDATKPGIGGNTGAGAGAGSTSPGSTPR